MLDAVQVLAQFFLHSVFAHAAVILLLAGPIFILMGAVLPSAKGRPYLLAALLLIALGTGALFTAFPGVDVAALQTKAGSAAAVRGIPEDLIWETRVVFSGLVLLYACIIAIPVILHQPDRRLFSTVLPLSFLVLYFAGAASLLSTMEVIGPSEREVQSGVSDSKNAQPLRLDARIRSTTKLTSDNRNGSTLELRFPTRGKEHRSSSPSSVHAAEKERISPPRKDVDNYAGQGARRAFVD